jgi:hypothetical protein
MIQDGAIVLDKPTSETSVDELNEIVVNEYRRAREEEHRRVVEEEQRRANSPEGATQG